jgi:membrane-bound ClpP family serine protease
MASLAALLPATPARAADSQVLVATLTGVINPITDTYVSNAVDRAVRNHATALVIAMDTPGGLDTSMRDIIQKIIAAKVPVVIFVSPSGARAASAGMYITEAADIAAMAPGTNIGSAHPVSIGGSNPAPSATPAASGTSSAGDIEDQKIENDAAAYARALATLHHHNADWAEKAVRQSINATADDAVKLGVVDLESRDLGTLLTSLDGRVVSKGGQSYTLHTANAAIVRYDLSGFDQLLQAVADPNLVYLLFLLAIIGIAFWVTHPGLVLPGVVGVIAGLLAAMSLFNLPINIAGVILILLAFLLFIIDLKAVTHGVLHRRHDPWRPAAGQHRIPGGGGQHSAAAVHGCGDRRHFPLYPAQGHRHPAPAVCGRRRVDARDRRDGARAPESRRFGLRRRGALAGHLQPGTATGRNAGASQRRSWLAARGRACGRATTRPGAPTRRVLTERRP